MERRETGNLIDLDDDDEFSEFQEAPETSTPPSSALPPHTDPALTSSPRPEPRPSQRSPPPPLSPSTTSSGYGIGSAVWGLLRRISTVDNPPTTPPGVSQLYNSNANSLGMVPGAGGDGINGAFTPPRRTATPRGLPSLDPINLYGYRADTDPDERLLARGVAEEIRTFLPERLKIMEDWRLVYSLYQNGSSLATLYQLCEKYRGVRAGFVLVVRDGKDGIFGAYLTEAPHPAASYYGTGECFLWRASLHAPLPPPPSADTTNLNYRTTTIASSTARAPSGSSSSGADRLTPGAVDPENIKRVPSPVAATQSVRFQTFAYTGANDYCMFCETKFLSVGGGHGGTFGLWLDDSLSRGHSAECDTFLNQPLSEEGEKFDILGVELWVVGAS
ncbi:TLD-domain-containing protein [Xylaria bambusicola]|uniref:TLD-domain-containing protein n=1 Tax=Xylaria bambusicola TaxID=326684 RepID=UPI002008D80F|nr:TLD-domain-containing protein [Xylaria bambusicola]KAI0517726.1 TLD-domain-containing protein [Xylaria bambusicola]